MQSKRMSLIESLTNTAAGFIISFLIWLFLVPVLFGIETRAAQGIGMTLLFTASSIFRGYVVRRIFNK